MNARTATESNGNGRRASRANRKSDEREALDPKILERQLPYDAAAEIGVLGSMLLKPDVCDDILGILRESDFYDQAHQKFFRAIARIRELGKALDTTLLKDALEKSGDWEAVGGAAYLVKIINAVPHAAHAIYYADIVRDKATLRGLIYAATDILQEAYQTTAEAAALPGKAEAMIADVTDKRLGKREVKPWRDFVNDSLTSLENRLAGHDPEEITTGIHELDDLTRGMKGGQFWVLGGRPSMGKSALALNIAEHIAEGEMAAGGERKVLFVSLEMGGLEFSDRMLSTRTRISSHRMAKGHLRADERERIVEAAAHLSRLPLSLDDPAQARVSEIAAMARRLKRKDELRAIIIDYLQLIEPDDHRAERHQQVGLICRKLKALAKETNVPLMALAQLNRQTENTRDCRPRLSHLRESGEIEQSADVVMFVHRPEYYAAAGQPRTPADQGEEAELILAKQRNGPTQIIPILWFKAWTQFANPAPDRAKGSNYEDGGF